MEEKNNDDAQALSMDEVVNSFMDLDTPDEDSPEDTPEEAETPEDENSEETETPEDEEDVDDDYLSDVDEDEVDDEPDDDVEEDKSDEEAKDYTETVKVDGVEHQVSRAELIKGYGLQKSLTQKGQELAAKEKDLEHAHSVVAYHKQAPEMKKLANDIAEANEALARGSYFDQDTGDAIPFSRDDFEKIKANVKEAEAKLSKAVIQPMQDEALKAIPELLDLNTPEATRNATATEYSTYLKEIGYTDYELPTISPRELLLTQQALKGIKLQAKVDAAKARKGKKKDTVVNKSTRSVKSESNNTKGKRKSTAQSDEKLAASILAGETPMSDMFLDLE